MALDLRVGAHRGRHRGHPRLARHRAHGHLRRQLRDGDRAALRERPSRPRQPPRPRRPGRPGPGLAGRMGGGRQGVRGARCRASSMRAWPTMRAVATCRPRRAALERLLDRADGGIETSYADITGRVRDVTLDRGSIISAIDDALYDPLGRSLFLHALASRRRRRRHPARAPGIPSGSLHGRDAELAVHVLRDAVRRLRGRHGRRRRRLRPRRQGRGRAGRDPPIGLLLRPALRRLGRADPAIGRPPHR